MPSTGKLYTFWIFERKKISYYVCQLTEKRLQPFERRFEQLKGKLTEQ